jgi:hypothetical protein
MNRGVPMKCNLFYISSDSEFSELAYVSASEQARWEGPRGHEGTPTETK